MLKLEEILKNVNVKSRNSETTYTYINVCMFYIYLIENKIGNEQDIKYRLYSLYNQIKKDKIPFRSYNYWFHKIKFLLQNEELFLDFVENHLDKTNENYLELSSYTK